MSKRGFTLNARLAFWVVMSLVVIEAIVLIPSYRANRTHLVNDKVEESRLLADMLVRHSVGEWELETISQELIGTRVFLGISIFEQSGRVITAAGDAPEDPGPVGARYSPARGHIDIYWPTAYSEGPLYAWVRVDASGLSSDLRAYLVRIAGLVAVIAAFVAGATVLAFHHLVLKRLVRLHHAISQVIESGPLAAEKDIDPGDGDELGDVIRAFNRMTAELGQSLYLAEQASEAKSQFLANASHELRTPLNGIIGFTELMMYLPNAEKQQEYIADIHRAAKHLLAIVNDLLDMERIEAGKVVPEIAPVDLEALVADVIRILQEGSKADESRFDVHAAPDLPSALADVRHMRQVLLNLLDNALKFSPADTPVTIAIGMNGVDEVSIAVTDKGIGIADHDLESVLKPFGQVADAFVSGKQGFGLGLPITKKLVELNGGRFEIGSGIDGRGTRVAITLPAISRAAFVEQLLSARV